MEAKPFKGDLDKREYIDQAINYAWHKGCTWAVLTNFETIKIFNAEVKTNHPWLSQFKSIYCSEFVTQFDDLFLLSRESLEKNILDREAEKWGKKATKIPIDKQLLEDFTKFRHLLSKNITKLNENKNLSQDELDESVQRILDRLIFIRNCEDRELEPKILISNYREWESKGKGQLIKSLRETFTNFDKNYNSKIFSIHLCDSLDIDNEVLHKVIEGLYKAYDFSLIDADVLGTIYEQYLSYILMKTEKRAKLTKNQLHRKQQGIYYTPTYIVDYIVRNTLGELLKDKKVNVEKIKVLDPACGSGSFLIKAFDVLHEYYRKSKGYNQTQLDLETNVPFTTKAKIIQNNIFGVDLDKQAVEIAQLNLLLKIAEKRHRLPVLERNIKIGNSLIDDDAVAGNKAFNWTEEFKEIFSSGGFDVIVGNPPYVRQEELGEIKPYLEANYETYQGTADLFVYFFEKELKLLKENGYFGMIVSNKWLRAKYGKNLRKFISQFWIEELIDFGDLRVFSDATIYPCIIILKKTKKRNQKVRICKMNTLEFGSLREYVKNNSFSINQNDLTEKEWNIQNREGNELIKKIRNSGKPIIDYVNSKINYGIKTGLNNAFIIEENKKTELIKQDLKSNELIKPYLTGAEIKRYGINDKRNYIILSKIGVEIKKYPAIYSHLTTFQDGLEKRSDKGKYWYELRACSYYDLFNVPKIIWGNLSTRSSFTLDETNGYYINAPACILPTNSKYVLGVLNSKLMSYFLKSICAERRGGFIEQKPVYVSQVPIKKPTDPQEVEVTKLVNMILELNKKLVELSDKITDERTRLEREITLSDSKIDELVYKIYDITPEEKAIIENSLK